MIKHDITLDIATATQARATKWKNLKTKWSTLVEQLATTVYTSETVAQYKAASKEAQAKIKDVGGFVGGRLMPGTCKVKGIDTTLVAPFGWRRNGFVDYRQVVALDVDHGTTDVWLDFVGLNCAGLFYTTHKHTEDDARFRIVFPLDRRVTPEEYEAIARIVASWLSIDMFDDTTYQPARLMYYPSTSKDGQFLFDHVDAAPLSADEVLAALDDWTDPTTWPVSSREADKVRPVHTGAKVQDPDTKTGIVGAFCHAYTIEEAIAEFLPDVYEPCEALGPDRYTFIGGSASGGLIVYDSALAFSHHETDPAGRKLCNAFDLVRLHKWGDLDENAAPDTNMLKLPSFKAMTAFASGLTPVKKEIVRMRRTEAASDYDDGYDQLTKEATRAADADDWIADLETEGKKGKIKNTINNVVIILANDENLKGRFAYNAFEQREVALKSLPWDKNVHKYPRPLEDTDDAQVRLYLENAYDITITSKITDGLAVITRANSYHPVRDYLDGVTWDGTPRLDELFIGLFGAEDTAYTRAVTRKAFTAAVARIYRPGCKFDYVVVIVGDQGIGKSTTLAKMGGDWFSDSLTDLTGNKALEALQGAWIVEMGELAGLRKAEVDAVKHFVSKKEDRYRVAYGRRIEHFPRRCVFFGTTNEEDFLRDVTGNRRFWVVNCKGRKEARTLDFKTYLTPVIIAQLWGEAKERLAHEEPLYLTDEIEKDAQDIQDAHLEKDDRAGLVSEYLDRLLPKDWANFDSSARFAWLIDTSNTGIAPRATVSCIEIWAECLGKRPEDMTRRDSLDIGRILKTFRNWEPLTKSVRIPLYGPQKVYTNNYLPLPATKTRPMRRKDS